MSHSHAVARFFGRIVIVVMSVGMLWLNEGLLVPAGASGTSPTISSDKSDYSPAELVTLTGTGWTGDATVHIDVNDTLGKTWEHTADVPVDANGNISDSFNLPDRFVSDYDVSATGDLSGRTAATTFTDSAGYSFSLKAAVPSAYPRLQPGSGTGRLACPGTNKQSNPLNNAQYGTASSDNVSSLAPANLALGQVVAFEMQIDTSSNITAGSVDFTTQHSTITTSNDAFGFDPSYGVYCAFIDTADSGNSLSGNESLSYTSTTVGNEIQGTYHVGGVDPSEKIVVEIWVVLDKTVPAGAGGNVQSQLVSAFANGGSQDVSGGAQTVPLNQVGQFFTASADVSVTKADNPDPVTAGENLTYTITVKNNSSDTVANGIVVSDKLDPNTTFVSAVSGDVPANPDISCSSSTGGFSCAAFSLSPGVSTVITVTVTVGAGFPTSGFPNSDTGSGAEAGNAGTPSSSFTCTTTPHDLCNVVSITALTSDSNLTNNAYAQPTNVLPPAPDTGSVQLAKTWSGTVGETTLAIGSTDGGTDVATKDLTGTHAGNGQTAATTVNTGTYFFSETNPRSGWTPSFSCSGAAASPTKISNYDYSLVVAKNETVLCTFTNTRDQGYFKIKKVFDPKTSGFNGSFTITYNCGGSDQTVTLTAGQTSSAIGPFDTGTTCTVEEKTLPTAPTGWTFGAATYDPTDVSTNGISITQSTAANTTQLVTVTNSISRDQGYFKIKKVFDNPPSGFNSSFTITYNCGSGNQTVTLAAGDTSAAIGPFNTGTVCKVVESTPLPALPSGWSWGTPMYSPTGATTSGITIVKNTTTTATLVSVTNTASFNSGALTIGFWQNKNGQGIIKTYCGSSTANTTKLVNWLRTFAPFQDLGSTTPCTGTNSVQSYVLSVIKAATCSSSDKTCNTMLKAQMLATALNVYFSDSSLGGPLIGAFNGNGSNQPAIGNLTVDLSTICKEIDGSGGSGACSGGYSLMQVQLVLGPNGAPTKSTDTLSGSSLTVMQILINVAKFSDPGGVPTKTNLGLKWYNQVKSSQVIAKDVFDSINNRAVKFI